MAPEGAPARLCDREKLWNMGEAKEIRKDAQLAREVQLSLPYKLNLQRRALVRNFVQRVCGTRNDCRCCHAPA
jgi:hypothetical protein